MSIIIIGVGNADFSKMEYLDGDEGALKDKYGRKPLRDIVQFVKYLSPSSLINKSEYNNYQNDITYLHEDVLREVPQQFLSYMEKNGIRPNPLHHTEINDIL